MSTDIWQKVIHGRPFDAVGIPTIDGRLDLRNLHVPEPHAVERLRMPRMDVTVLGGITSIKGVSWQSIDFSGSQLPGLRFLDCQIRNCVFDRCGLGDLRVWRTNFANVSFRSADLRDAMLGNAESDRRVTHDVDFSSADMRGTMYGAAEFAANPIAQIGQGGFQSAPLPTAAEESCATSVLPQGVRLRRFPPNEMKRVDLRRASCGTAFKGLDLESLFRGRGSYCRR